MPAPRLSAHRLTIGAVLAELQEEFPEVTVSKIRFLESEGLVVLERTPAGYRVFGPADVERLRYILRAQRDRFWPLRVIRESLDAIDRGLQPSGSQDARPRPRVPADDPDVPSTTQLAARTEVRLTRRELAEASGLDSESVASLEGFGLVKASASGYFGEHDLRVASAAAALAAYGIESRHLRPFRTAADREVGLVEQAMRSRRPGADRESHEQEVTRLCLQLHAALVKGGLSRG